MCIWACSGSRSCVCACMNYPGVTWNIKADFSSDVHHRFMCWNREVSERHGYSSHHCCSLQITCSTLDHMTHDLHAHQTQTHLPVRFLSKTPLTRSDMEACDGVLWCLALGARWSEGWVVVPCSRGSHRPGQHEECCHQVLGQASTAERFLKLTV